MSPLHFVLEPPFAVAILIASSFTAGGANERGQSWLRLFCMILGAFQLTIILPALGVRL